MNPLTQIKNTQKATKAEIELGISDKSSWHARFKHSAYVFVGGLPFELTEGDILAVFCQYGEIVDVHLVRDKQTGKSKGFAFLAYEDQRSTVLAVDNLSGARVASRTIRVEHVDSYKKKRAEMEGEPIPSDSEPEGEEEGRGQEGQRRQSPGNEEERRNDRGAGAGGASEDAPWAGGNSVFSMLAQARQQGINRPWNVAEGDGGGGRGEKERGGDGGRRKEKKHKKEKKEKKDRKERKRSRSRSRGPRGEDTRRDRGGDREVREERGGRREDRSRSHRSRSRSREARRQRSYSPRRR